MWRYLSVYCAIGTIFGPGDGATTFNLPDLRGRVAMGDGQAPGLSARSIGTTLGEETHTLGVSEMPSHSHSGTTGGQSNGHWHEQYAIANFNSGGAGIRTTWTGDGSGALPYDTGYGTGPNNDDHTHSIGTDPTGGNGAHNNIQPTLVLSFIIKY